MLFRVVLSLAVMLSSAVAFSQDSPKMRGQGIATIAPSFDQVQAESSEVHFSVLTGRKIRDRIQELGGAQIEADLLNRAPIEEAQRPSMSRILEGVQSVTEDSGAKQRAQPVRKNASGQFYPTNESESKKRGIRKSGSELLSSSLVARNFSALAGADVVMESQCTGQLRDGVSDSSMGTMQLVAQNEEAAENSSSLCTEFTLDILLDDFPVETTWRVLGPGDAVVAEGGPYNEVGAAVQSVFCLPDACYEFIIYDAYGDGICCGYGSGNYVLSQGNNVIVSGGAFTTQESTEFCVGENLVPGCTDSFACNFSADAQADDGSCDYSCIGCFDWSDLPTPLPPTTGPDNLPHFFDEDLGTSQGQYFQAFDFPSSLGQISLQFLNLGILYCGQWPPVEGFDGPFDDPVDMTVSIYSHDAGVWNGEPSVLELEGEFVYTITEETVMTTVSIPLDVTFDLAEGSEDNVVVGINLPNMSPGGAFFLADAPNVNGNVAWLTSDGLSSPVYNLAAYWANPSLQISLEGCSDCSAVDACGVCGGDGSSCFFGCTDPGACNYDAGSVEDDGSCSYEGCYGCTDDTACNYDDAALADDGTCNYDCGGCLDVSSSDGLIPYLADNNGVLDTALISPCMDTSLIAQPTTFYQTFDVDAPSGQYTILSFDMMLGFWADGTSGQWLASSWDVTYNVYGNLTGSSFDGDLSSYGLLASITETYSAEYALNGGLWSPATVSLGQTGVTMDVVSGGVDDVIVEIIPGTSDALTFYFLAYEPAPGSALWVQSESCALDSPAT